jgi:hypothetical protein
VRVSVPKTLKHWGYVWQSTLLKRTFLSKVSNRSQSNVQSRWVNQAFQFLWPKKWRKKQ